MSFRSEDAQHPPFVAQPGQPPHYFQNRGPPPLKKPKGNPVITRYPPPPGYRPPIPPPPQYAPTQWQQPAQALGHGYPPYGAYQQPLYDQVQPYQVSQAPYAGYPPQQQSASGYHFVQPGFSPSAQPTWQELVTSPQSAPPMTNHLPPNQFNQAPRRHSSAPYPYSHDSSGYFDEDADPYPQQYSPSISDDEDDGVDEDFSAECYFARHPELIDQRFSLGLIEWKAPLPTRRPLPSTFGDAELEALAPRAHKTSDDESISEYFVESQRDDSLNSIRLSETWHTVKDDLIFREFPEVCRKVLSLFELLTTYKDRFDPHWAAGERISATPELSRHSTPATEQAGSDRMEVDSVHALPGKNRVKLNAEDRILDELEHALSSRPEASSSTKRRSIHSRSTSVTSQNLPKPRRPKPLPPLRDQAQEDVLAALGVTGSPMLVYETPGPAFGPPPDSNMQRNGRLNSFHSSRAGPLGTTHPLPAPPFFKRDKSPSYDPWANDQQGYGYTHERPVSAASHHTTAGSDFDLNNDEATPRPKLKRRDSRKRGHVDSEDEHSQDHQLLDDEVTPKQRRKQARVSTVPR